MNQKHIVIDARIRRASTGRPVDRLLEHLQSLDATNRYSILLQPDDPWQPTASNFRAVDCKYAQFSFNPLQQLTFSLFLYRMQANLVYFTLTGQQPLLYFGKQITLTHDLTMYEYVRAGKLPNWLHNLRMLGYKLIMYAAHKKALAIIVPTEYVKQGLSKFHPFTADKITVTLEASELPIQETGIKPKTAKITHPFIMHVGIPFAHKNIEQLVKAFGILLTKNPELKLVLAGKKHYYFDLLQTQIDASPARKNIVVTGFISSQELKWLYQNADAYVLPSLSEGFGLPGLEAMVHGCPLVSSNATCLPEVYGDAAHYFDPTNVTDMANKIQEVLDNPTLRTSLIQKGYMQAKKYSWQRMAEQTLEVYQKILG